MGTNIDMVLRHTSTAKGDSGLPYQVNPYTVDMSKGLFSNGLEINDQYLVLEIYFVFHVNCKAPDYDPHTSKLGPADNPDLSTVCSCNRCYSGVYVLWL